MKFSDRMKDLLEKGLDGSKDFLAKAGTQAQIWGEKGKLKFEILQLRSKAQSLTSQLGTQVFELLEEKGEPMIGSQSEGIAPLLQQMKDIEREISEKESAYRMAGGKDGDLDGDGKPD